MRVSFLRFAWQATYVFNGAFQFSVRNRMKNVLQFGFHRNHHKLIYRNVRFCSISAFIALEGFPNATLIVIVKFPQVFYAHAVQFDFYDRHQIGRSIYFFQYSIIAPDIRTVCRFIRRIQHFSFLNFRYTRLQLSCFFFQTFV